MDVEEMVAVEDEEKLSNEIKGEEPTPGCYIKCRHVLALMLFFGLFNLFSLRVNLNVAIVAMVNTTESDTANMSESCPDHGASRIDKSASNGIFQWDRTEQGLVLGSYFYGYIITGLPGGYLASRYGVKPVLGITTLLSSIITLLTPTIAYMNFTLFVASRILIGLLQGVTLPAMQAAWGRWAPPTERIYLISTSFSGTMFGVFCTLLVAGAIAENLGWEAVFYVTGGIGLLWTCIWYGIIYSWPEDHPRISAQERSYILKSIGVDRNKNTKRRIIPWHSILTSVPAWAISVSLFCNLWGTYTVLTMLPTYMATILRFSLTESGGMSAIPYILPFFCSLGMGYISDELRRRRILRTTTVRKINTTLGAIVPAALLVLAGYVGCDFQAAEAFFSLAVAFTGFSVPGSESNTVDLAPEFSGVVYGVSNTIANIPGFLAPQIVGIMLEKDGSLNQWRMVFWMTAVIYTFGAVFYLIFASAEEQPWASQKPNCHTETKYIEMKVKTDDSEELVS